MGNGIKNVTGHSLDDAIHILENNDHDLDKRLTIVEKNQELNKEWQDKMDLKIQKIDDGIGEIRQCVKPKMRELETRLDDHVANEDRQFDRDIKRIGLWTKVIGGVVGVLTIITIVSTWID